MSVPEPHPSTSVLSSGLMRLDRSWRLTLGALGFTLGMRVPASCSEFRLIIRPVWCNSSRAEVASGLINSNLPTSPYHIFRW
jgi:hypothetical protein